jgi:hypothetical protein
MQDEFSTNCDFADFFGGSPGIAYSKSQFDTPIYWRSDSLIVPTSPFNLALASGNGNRFFTQKLHVQIGSGGQIDNANR